MLPEDKRLQLDGIVQKMIANKESDSNIKFVVDDFKKKYTPAETTTKPQSNLLQKATKVVTSIFPGGKIGEAIGTGIAKLKATPEEKPFITPGPTPLQVGADVASVGLNLALLGGAGAGGNFITRVAKMAGLGASLSGAETIKEGGGVKDVAKSTALGGVVGASIPVAGKGLRLVGEQIAKLPARFVNSALSRSKAQVLQDIAKDKVDDFAKYVVQKKPIGTANKLVNESIDNVGKLGEQVSKALGGSKSTIGRDVFLDNLVKLPEAQGALLKRTDIRSIIEKLAPQSKQILNKTSWSLQDANKLRGLVDKTLGDRAFLGGQLSSDKIILKQFANTLREAVKTKAPVGTRELFNELSNEIRFRDGLLEKVAQRAGNQVLSFGDFIGGGLGGMFGGGLPGAVAGVATRRAIESVPFKLGSAKFINSLTKLAPTIEQLAPAQQTAILNFFSEIFSEENQQANQRQ
jgi:hypothetical protein